MKNILVLSLLVIFSSACEFIAPENTSNTNFSDITIKSGQSFGFCIGKCHSEMIIKGQEVEFLVKERNFNEGILDNKEYTYKEVFTTQKTRSISEKIDLDKFFALNDVYGCPDCADGGSEWIEIITGKDKSKKVTFEYGKSIPEIENLIKLLREERLALQTKYVK